MSYILLLYIAHHDDDDNKYDGYNVVYEYDGNEFQSTLNKYCSHFRSNRSVLTSKYASLSVISS